MLKYDTESHQFEKLEATELKEEGLLERYDLQKAIGKSWDLFKNEIGFPEAYLIGQEINPDPSIGNSIDLLVFDPSDSSIIVIELKRDKNKLQLLQALTYSAMLSKWGADELIDNIQLEFNPAPEELIDFINNNELNPHITTVLIAESYDPEVIITADWLREYYGVEIIAFAINLHKMGEQSFLEVEQRYPLKELTDVYELRSRRQKKNPQALQIEWSDVLPKLKYPFAQKGIDLCLKIHSGEPGRRRFRNVRSHYDGFSWITLNFRVKYINVYLGGDFKNAQQLLQSKFNEPIKIGTWKEGYSFLVETEGQFEDLVKWLSLDS